MGICDFSSISICVDEYEAGEMKGRIYSSLREEPETFNSVITLIKNIDKIFDEGEYPQATMKVRGFNKPGKTQETAKKIEKPMASVGRINFSKASIKGRKATFGVRVMFRQNASWQGSLNWIEKNREESFRSVLEMIMLIDSAFEAETAAAKDASNELRSVNM